jgi:hypothetical protein
MENFIGKTGLSPSEIPKKQIFLCEKDPDALMNSILRKQLSEREDKPKIV